MQIRLTVALAPRGARGAGGTGSAGTASRTAPPPGTPDGYANVLVTAPAGTVLAAITGALATSAASALAVSAGQSAGPPKGQGPDEGSQEPVVVYAGTRRLDPHRQIIGEQPLLDGAVISLHAPVTPAALPAHGAAVTAYGSAKARLHVVAGPDAGGIHLLQGGKVHLGRSAEADVPLDDPDVSRLHCAVTVTDGGAVTVTDIGSTNGTTLDGAPVGARPVLFRPGATLRIGETAIRLEAAVAPEGGSAQAAPLLALPTAPDGEGRLRVVREESAPPPSPSSVSAASSPSDPADPSAASSTPSSPSPSSHPSVPSPPSAASDGPAGHRADAARGEDAEPPPHAPALPAVPPDGDAARGGEGGHAYAQGGPFPGASGTHGAGFAQPPLAGPEERRRARGLGAWARRFAGGRAEPGVRGEPDVRGQPGSRGGTYGAPVPGEGDPEAPYDTYGAYGTYGTGSHGPGDAEAYAAHPSPGVRGAPWEAPELSPVTGDMDARWPDPAAVLLTALGPGPRLWERGPEHPDALTVRVGSTYRGTGHGDPVTVALRQAGSLGLAGPRSRLTGLTRSVLAQLTALHGPSGLEVVLLSTDRARSAESRAAEWSWLGWLPHLRPAHGQDCGLLMAYDREQAAARIGELVRRLEAHGAAPDRGTRPGPAVLVVVDGDPGPAALRASLGRLAREGAEAGIHLLCLAETPPASPASPVTATVEAANAACPVLPECGTLALLSGDVATAVRVLYRTTPHPPGLPERDGTFTRGADVAGSAGLAAGTDFAGGTDVAGGHGFAGFTAPTGPVATVDAVSAAWAERFARALAPLREPEGSGPRPGAARPAVTLPPSCRLLDELGLARATPAALLARWSERGGDTTGHAPLVFGAGPHGPLEADLADLSPLAGLPGTRRNGRALPGHALLSGGPGSGKTELLRSLAASLAAGERPDRLALVLVDGAGAEAGDGLRACAELPHVTGHLAAGDPVRMREFAQALSAELKRRAELIGDQRTYEDYVRTASRPGDRVIAQRQPPDRDRTARAERPERAAPAAHEGERTGGRAELASGQGRQGAGAALGEERAPDASALDTLPQHAPDGQRHQAPSRTEPTAQARAEARADTRTASQDQGPARPGSPGEARAQTHGQGPAQAQAQDRTPGQAQDVTPGQAQVQDRMPGQGQGQGEGRREAAGQAAGPAAGQESASLDPDTTRRTLRLRPREERAGTDRAPEGPARGPASVFAMPGGSEAPLPRLTVLVDDFDTLVDPALGNPGRPAAGSVVRALDAVARQGARLGVHVIAATGREDRTAGTGVAQGAALRAELGASEGSEETPQGRGTLTVTVPQTAPGADSGPSNSLPPLPFQAGRVTGRIPRTATLRPTVVPLDWTRAGDPPARRHVRELGNGPTDLALLASAMERAAASLGRPAPARATAASRSRSGQDEAVDG